MSDLVLIDGKYLNCVLCGNYGRKIGCPICGRVKTRVRELLEEQYRKAAYSRTLSADARREISDKARAVQAKLEEAKTREMNLSGVVTFMQSLWDDLKHFQMTTTGHTPLDTKLRNLFGEWMRVRPASEDDHPRFTPEGDSEV